MGPLAGGQDRGRLTYRRLADRDPCSRRPDPAQLTPPCKCSTTIGAMVTIDSVRAVAHGLPRSYEVVVRGRVKFRVGQIVWLAFSLDETMMGLAFPKEER